MSFVSEIEEVIKASYFPASLLKIGNWEYRSRNEGDLMACFFFMKHAIAWEVLDDAGVKNTIETKWTDVKGLKADCPDSGLSSLTVVLGRQPLFFRDTNPNPHPRKHSFWEATTDFTGGEASMNRLQFPQGTLHKHFERLIQFDTHLNNVSRQPEMMLDSPYFDDFQQAGSSGQYKEPSRPHHHPMSKLALMNYLDSIIAPVADPSPAEAAERKAQLEHLAEILVNDISDDSHLPPLTDEKSVMARINSLCSLLQKQPVDGSKSARDIRAMKRSMMKRDSYSDLLLNLPRIASLLKFLNQIFEDGDDILCINYAAAVTSVSITDIQH
ncbi:hypothetical protein QQ045_002820 [Rhodiola kirilowii]